jgi:hypothetical protein
MKWTVKYRRLAKDDLAALWLDAPDRQVLAEAADAIDAELASDPLTAGEGRGGSRRLVINSPLAAYFVVDESTRTVTVTAFVPWS